MNIGSCKPLKRIKTMKFFISVFLAVFIQCSAVFGQRIVSPYEVGTWQGFKEAAISYTFDDNCPNQLPVAVPLFDTYGYKVTLFTVISYFPNWSGLQAAANSGHEIGSHTVTHPSLDSISYEYQEKEYRDSKDIINTKITGQKCVTIAYPFCAWGNSKLCSEYFISARSCDGHMEPSTARDFMCIGSVNCGLNGQAKTAEDMNAKVESAIPTNGWCIFMMHGIDNDQGFSPLSSKELASHLKYVDDNKSRYWVNSFGNVTRYIKERNAVSLIEQIKTSKSIKIQLTDTLDNSIFNFPLTIRRPLPKGWKGAGVMQDEVKLPVQLIKKESVRYIQFDAVPNAGVILISKEKKPVWELK